MNSIVAYTLKQYADELEKASDFEKALNALIEREVKAHWRIVFNGNGYSDEWVAEAERRGLPNIKSMVEAIPVLTSEKAIAMFGRFGVFTKAELESRVEIKYENYAKAINIEAKTMIDVASKQIIPAVVSYTKSLADTVIAVTAAGAKATVQSALLKDVSDLLEETKAALAKLVELDAEAAMKEEGAEQAVFFHEVIMPAMESLRAPVDKLEMIVDKDVWPMPSYGDLIFEV